jgi:glycosyltransferase involved in cell wall biosynthesis
VGLKKIDLQILLPVFNEAKHIEKTLEEIHLNLKNKINYKFIISEDGSTDGTKTILNKLKDKYDFILISDKLRKGYSNAVMDGMKIASKDYLMILDSDGQCDPKEIYKFWTYRKNFDIISGNRINRKDFMYRKIFSQLAYLIYNLLFSVPLKDPSYACSLMNKKVYTSLRGYKVLCEYGFFWEFNARAKKKKFTFKELKVNHKLRKEGNTKIYLFRNLPVIAIKHLWAFIKIRFFIK